MPWHAITLSANGDIKPCCQFSNKGRMPNTEHDTIMENFNSERMQDLRKDFLKGVQTPEVQEAIRTHPQFSALLHTHTYRDALLAIETKDGKYINVQEITRFANSL